jgi:hypothetical protein
MAAQKSLELGDRIEDRCEHTSLFLTVGTSTTAHIQRGQFAFGVAGIPLIDHHWALSHGSVVKDGQRALMILVRRRFREERGYDLREVRYRSYKSANQLRY